ncbi:MAG: hypothetical protein KOO61_09745 [Spirochaetales bacterium]|nr:hypothetical protein [Spirochaetales bacterium]
MKIYKFVCVATVLLTLVAVILPAETGDDGEFGEGFGAGFSDNSEFDSFGAASSGPEISGSLEFVNRIFPDVDDPAASEFDAWPELKLRLGAENDHGSFAVELAFDNALMDPALDLNQLIREASVRMFAGPVTMEFGLLRRVWGKGDELHVVDVLNATDYSDPGSGGYLDSRIAIPMAVLEAPFRQQGLLEVAYVPVLVADRIPADGRWAPAEYTDLLTLAAAGVILAGPPARTTLDSAQVGVRLTDTFGPLDLGLVYYYGYLKQPSVDRTAFIPMPVPSGTITLDYDRVHVAGAEAAAVAGPLNLRGEAAWYATADTEGDNPAVSNPSVRYLAGFDIDIPISNLNLNAQVLGSVLLLTEQIGDNGPIDFEHDDDGVYTSHLIAGSLRDTYAGERFTAELGGAWYVETGDFVVRPALTIGFGDVLTMRIGGTLFEGDANTFLGQYDENDFLEIELAYDY